jgi:hypothetical protein
MCYHRAREAKEGGKLPSQEGLMIEPLQRALEQVEQLPLDDQAVIAGRLQRMLEELADERRWRELFADPLSPELLDRLADEALAEYQAGLTIEGGWDEPYDLLTM